MENGATNRIPWLSVVALALCLLIWVVLSSSCAPENDNFHFGKGVSTTDQQEIRAGVDAFNQWLFSTRGAKMTHFSVFAESNIDSLVIDFDAYGGGVQPGALVGLLSFFGSGGSITVGPNVFIYTGAAWDQASQSSHEFVVAHEAFHVAQFELLAENDRYLDPADSGPNPPDWLIEGSADYVAAKAMDLAKLRPFADSEAQEQQHAESVSAKLQQLETTSPVHTPGDASPYSQGFLATEMLTAAHSDASLFTFFEKASVAGTPWPQAFQQAFGEDLDAFYGRYESARSEKFPAYAGAVSGRLLDTGGSAAWGGIVLACNGQTHGCATGWAAPDGRFKISVADGTYAVFGASSTSKVTSSSGAKPATVAGNTVEVGDIVKPGDPIVH